MYFRICINRLGNIIKHCPNFLRICQGLNLNSYFFSSYSIFIKNLKIAIDIWQGTAILKLRTVYAIIRKDILQKIYRTPIMQYRFRDISIWP